jgi:hypothetical protein
LWVLVFFAAVMAALALAAPAWRMDTAPLVPTLDVEWSVRSLQTANGQHVEAWVHAPHAPGDITLVSNGSELKVSAVSLQEGMAMPLPVGSDDKQVLLELRSRGRILASGTFKRADEQGPFALLLQSSSAGIDDALQRVFMIQPGVHLGDPSIQPAVLLVNDQAPRPEDLSAAELVIAQPGTPLPGITLGPTIPFPSPTTTLPAGEGWTPEIATGTKFSWPRFVALQGVRVKALRQASFSADWQILATANGRPWIALREIQDMPMPPTTGKRHVWLWLASDPVTDTNWPSLPSFVLFFAEIQHRALASPQAPLLEWTAEPLSVAPRLQTIFLSPYFGAGAILLLLTATTWFIFRIRR